MLGKLLVGRRGIQPAPLRHKNLQQGTHETPHSKTSSALVATHLQLPAHLQDVGCTMFLSRRLIVLLGTGTDDQHWMAQLCQRPHLQGAAGVRSMLRAQVLRCKLRHRGTSMLTWDCAYTPLPLKVAAENSSVKNRTRRGGVMLRSCMSDRALIGSPTGAPC